MKKITTSLFLIISLITFGQQIISVSPSSANAGETLNVTITGRNTRFTQGSSTNLIIKNYFSQGSETIIKNYYNVINDTLISYNLTVQNDAVDGNYNFSMQTINGQSFGLKNAFYVNSPNSPKILSISPTSANAGETLDVTITGLNTTFTQGSSTDLKIENYFKPYQQVDSYGYYFTQGSSSIIQNYFNVTDNNTIVYNISIPNDIIGGFYDFSMYTSDHNQLFGLKNALNINSPNSPKILSVSPTSANAGETLDVTITGLNTTFTQGSSTTLNIENYFMPNYQIDPYFGYYFIQGSSSIIQNSFNVIDNNTIQYNITIPNNSIGGFYDFSMYTNDRTQLFGLEDAFNVNPAPTPSIVSVNPSTANAGQTLNVTILGQNTHFTQGSSTILEFGFDPVNAVNSFNIISDTEIQANITVPANVYSGLYDLYANNNIDGSLSLLNSFQVVGNPCSITADYSFTDNGGGNYSFLNGSSGNVVNVQWNFGDGSTSSLQNPSHTFTANGYYVVVLTVTDSLSLNGYCFDYEAKLVHVTGVNNSLNCNAGFSMIPDVNSNYVYVFNSSFGNNLNYYWDFGDGSYSNEAYPNHNYTTAGPFNLCLYVYDGSGCNSYYCDTIDVDGTVVRQFGFSINVTTPNSVGINDQTKTSNQISVFPNPGNGIYILNFKEFKSLKKYSVVDMLGNIILTKTIDSEKTIIDISNFSAGIYILKTDGFNPIRLIKD
jgi:PKD repeat protein